MWQLMLAGMLATLLLAGPLAAEVTKAPFGKTRDGTEVDQYTLKNKNGMTVKVMTLGATITEISVPDKNGKFANVAFGFDDVAGYESDRNQYFGCTTGRVANRIAKGMFTLDGKEYKLAVNNGPNHLHGGVKRSLDKVVWKATEQEGPRIVALAIRVSFLLHQPRRRRRLSRQPQDRGYLFCPDDKNELMIYYRAKTDKATPVNLTNHTYFNLAGAGADTALDHELMIPAESYIATDDELIPTGKIAPVAGTIFDFNKLTRIGDRIEKLYDTGAKGYDLCYVRKPSKEPTLAAKLRDPSSGRVLTVLDHGAGHPVLHGQFPLRAEGQGRQGLQATQRHLPGNDGLSRRCQSADVSVDHSAARR